MADRQTTRNPRTTVVPATIPALLAEMSRRYGSTVAIVEPNIRLTYAELHAAAREVTRAAIATGIEPGDRVALWAPNSAHWITTALGMLGAGATLVPLGTRLRGAEAAAILRRARCRMLFTVRGFLDTDYPLMLSEQGPLPDLRHTVLLPATAPSEHGAGPRAPLLDWARFRAAARSVSRAEAEVRTATVDPDDICDVLFTSGTTGAPKGVLSTHRRTLSVLDRWADAVTLRHGDRCLLVNPFSHTFGYKAGIVACLLRAATMVPLAIFEAESAAKVLIRERITVLAGPPTVFTDLLRVGARFPALRLAGTGGAAIPESLVGRIRTELGAAEVFTAYGLTESIGVVTVCAPGEPTERTARTVGKSLPGSEIRIVDAEGRVVPSGTSGEIVVRGPNVMCGYLDDPAATAHAVDSAGWLHTGDVGSLDPEGYLRITDRLKNMFIAGGFNVYPAEVEQALLEYPGIAEAAVIGIPDDRLGEVGAAFVVVHDPAAFDPGALLAWCRTRLAGYKVPRVVRVLDRLPRNTTGKVRRRDLPL
ncbi:AMP-binding protein [Nocardia spumae]|uniref:AMP-binding protein n=1 Tax=Nocardia spumae TaxID=2887190 RepID=UPI001D14E001|nr:AMP-binding protein [Nocardia spumae]